MRSNRIGRFVLVLASALALTVSAHPGQDAEHQAQERHRNAHSGNSLSKPVKLIGAILVPGNPLRFDISWVDQATAMVLPWPKAETRVWMSSTPKTICS